MRHQDCCTLFVGLVLSLLASIPASGQTPPVPPPGKLSAGALSALVLKPDQTVWTWGINWNGELGDGTFNDRPTPAIVPDLDDVIAVSKGSTHALALRADGTVWSWGANWRGELGTGSPFPSNEPVQVEGLTDVVAISAGWVQGLALKSDGTVWAWGANDLGQLGDGTQLDSLTPVQVVGLTDITAIAAGWQHALALRSDGTVWAWGDNAAGELGDGSFTAASVPQIVPGLTGVDMIATTSNSGQSFARTSDGHVWAWGYNAYGELGLGFVSGSESGYGVTSPQEATAFANAREISVGIDHTLVIASDGTVWAAGMNESGELGDGTTIDRASPVQVQGLTDIAHVAAGGSFSLALKADGTLYAWGLNALWEFGDGTTENALTPRATSAAGLQWTAPPTFSVAGGTYSTEQTVVMASSTAGATIHYTTNGEDPTLLDASQPSGESVVIGEPTTLKARANATGAPPSGVTSATYEFRTGTPIAAPPGGTYAGAQTVALSTETNGAEIRYTTDGSEPTASSALYSTAIAISSTTTIKAKAFRSGWQDSNTRVATYVLGSFGMVAAGEGHTLALLPDGSLWSWGNNDDGQLGDGTTTARGRPGLIPGLSEVTAISAGRAHSVARRSDGTVWVWGANDRGQLGLGTNDAVETPTAVPGLTDVVAISAGWQQTLVLKSNGTVWAWGANEAGQLGDGTQNDSSVPVQVAGVAGATAIAAGWQHGLALLADGTVRAWGDNFFGQIGDGTEDPALQATAVSGLTGVNFIASGPYAAHSWARKADGSVWGWGMNLTGELGLGHESVERVPAEVAEFENARLLTAGGDHTLAILDNGTVWGTGLNDSGQLGDGTLEDRLSPVQTLGLTEIVHAAGGGFYSVALKADGTVYAWGDNYYSQLGDGTTQPAAEPVAISGPGFAWKLQTPQFSVASGTYATDLTVTLTTSSPSATIHYTTNGDEPALSDSSVPTGGQVIVSEPLTLKAKAYAANAPASEVGSETYAFKVGRPRMSPPARIHAGAQEVVITTVTANAEIHYTVNGSEPTGASALYTGPLVISGYQTLKAKAFRAGWQDSNTATATYSLGSLAQVAGGERHSMALLPDGTLWTWGGNDRGQLGDGTTQNRAAPTAAAGVSDVIAIAAGHAHSLALRMDGSVWAWGANDTGQLGNGSTEDSAVPAPVTGLDDVIAVAAGSYHSLALKSDGTIWAWGAGGEGQLGDGEFVDHTQPVRVSGLTDIVAIAGGWLHSLALKSDGTTWAWGHNGIGQLGDGTTYGSFVPKQVASLAGIAWMGSGPTGSHNFARTETGQVWVWGHNSQGELGIGTTTEAELTPVEAGSLAGLVQIAAGGEHTVALKADGTVWAWGWNGDGELGDGTLVARATPAAVPGLADIVSVAAGRYFSLAIRRDGKVYAWGNNDAFQLGVETPAVLLEAGAVVATPESPTFTPPAGAYGQEQAVLITSDTPGTTIRYTTDGSEPTMQSPVYRERLRVAVTTTLKARAFRTDAPPSAVATASYDLDGDGVPAPAVSKCTGRYVIKQSPTITSSDAEATLHYTLNGQDPTSSDPSVVSGNTVLIDHSARLKVAAFKDGVGRSDVRVCDYMITGAVSAGGISTAGIKMNGTLWTWTVTPSQVSGITDAVAVSPSWDGNHLLFVKADGTVWARGNNDHGQLGDGTWTNRTVPVQVTGLTAVIAVAAGSEFSVALKDDGTVWAWGRNDLAQLGAGAPGADSNIPVQVSGLAGVTQIAVGQATGYALKTNGAASGDLWAWGDASGGKIGNGSSGSQGTPVNALSDVTRIGAGASNAYALRADGRGWAWGSNVEGQIGSELASDPQPMPIAIQMPRGAVDVDGMVSDGVALRPDGTVWMWGTNDKGQLGDGNSSGLPNPTPSVVRLSPSVIFDGVIAASGGGSHIAVLRSDGHVWAWGRGDRLGDGIGQVDQRRPVQTLFSVGDNSWLSSDPDQDGLSTALELTLGTDPEGRDTNHDGIPDGVAEDTNLSPTVLDMDGDGVPNSVELAQGTDPFQSDTDQDGSPDGSDCFPADPTRSQCSVPDPNDHTPPTITLTEPTNATLISVVPPQ